jgi:hypothetical protein
MGRFLRGEIIVQEFDEQALKCTLGNAAFGIGVKVQGELGHQILGKVDVKRS